MWGLIVCEPCDNDLSSVKVFYAACQGLLYVLCYRLEQLMARKPAQRNNSADSLTRLFKDVVPVLLNSRSGNSAPPFHTEKIWTGSHPGYTDRQVSLNDLALSSLSIYEATVLASLYIPT